MCGIVVYYGNAQNRLTRILTGMWAIIYRAPDSTGIGLVGSDLEPLKIRRALGSVENLIDRLMLDPVFEETDLQAGAFMADDMDSQAGYIARFQKRLLAHEGFSFHEAASFPTWSQMTNLQNPVQVMPGTCGDPRIRKIFAVDSPKALKAAMDYLIQTYDLPVAVVEKLIRNELAVQVDAAEKSGALAVDPADLFHEFQIIFNRYAYDEAPVRPRRVVSKQGQKNPFARKYVWHFLRKVRITLPADYTTDGIAHLFRYLDAWVLNGLTPEAAENIQLIFETFWKAQTDRPVRHWQILYRIERTCNVYGLAVTAVLAHYQTKIYMHRAQAAPAGAYLPAGHVPGPTHPLLLLSMVQPVIGQGRWALQSAISVRNAHPFMDRQKVRAVVLNGQFDSDVESRIHQYVTRVANIGLRTENSTELFAMLWGHYFETAWHENQRYRTIEDQHRLGLEELSICSQSIDYTIFKTLSNKTIHDIDEMAFIKAVQAMTQSGGQFAVSGISRVSPDRLFVAAHHRPVYIVKRRDTSDFMVVSDINAALGLFPQTLIRSTRVKLFKLMKTYSKKSMIVESDFSSIDSRPENVWFRQAKKELLKPFLVDVYVLDQPEIFARIQTTAGKDAVIRHLQIQDFSGRIRSDIRPEQTWITPVSFQKDFGKTFYEEHLDEIPGLMGDIVNRYADTKQCLPRFDIRQRLLERRFGSGLTNLNRIILVGTGFSYMVAEIAEKTMEPFFPTVNLLVAAPQDFADVRTAINPDRDLVVMVSWSGTTSDMIDFAGVLLKHHILMVGITEKPFSDMALVVRKSAGVIPVYSGEEVTVAPLKSALCMLLTLDLFCLSICLATPGTRDVVGERVKEILPVPAHLDDLFKNPDVTRFCKEIAAASGNSVLHYVVDAYHDVGAARIGALNLELNAWTSLGNAVDYSEQELFLNFPVAEDEFVLVLATSRHRLDEAVRFMAALHETGRTFFAITYLNRELEEIQRFAQQVILVPKLPDHFQPFVDLSVLFLLGFYFGQTHGRRANEMPRNMAKSVTAGRTRNGKDRSYSDILDDMDQKQDNLGFGMYPVVPRSGSLCWLTLASDPVEKRFYQDLLALGRILNEPDAFSGMFSLPEDRPENKVLAGLADLIFTNLAEDGVLIFVPMDKQAEAGCMNLARLWEPFLGIPVQVEFAEKLRGVTLGDSLMVVVASQTPAAERVSAVFARPHKNMVWIGPENTVISEKKDQKVLLQAFYLKHPDLFCRYEQTYVALSLFFAKIMSYKFPGRATRFISHFKTLLPVIQTLLADSALHRSIQQTLHENLSYKKQLFLTGMRGNCIAWKIAFAAARSWGVESDPFGVSAYSHLVLVDCQVQEKYRKLAPRDPMVKIHGEKQVRVWETRYLGGASVDAFLSRTPMLFSPEAVLPFYVDDQWYLPVLRPEYDTDNDCLIIIDATSEMGFDAALDELATFGSRYARMVVITQQGFAKDARLANLKKYPLSHIVMVPGPLDKHGEPGIISDYLLPVVISLMGAAMKFFNPAEAGPEKQRRPDG
ncbi:SIS domain-containing protein [Desulfotignum phosphitoxidans]|uniref:Glutamine--fructose-6-phosphate aminotransferase [isomerizing] n=1 Tax=Desulfotignum phosphitoxidans DSM 13687 TaxID=1286635 RepID=S0FZB5_9BACT|nr:SIS domain-containing protein [Desulfotignum phosphitoxidans]EMS77292.1 glucosamine 6-phosphate synthetase [Desulfotignum phosphitoxidans DSM 13687]